ncbi:tetratricopeptide repeat protein [Simplicispira psychrophila]|uniref:tetratricopeptide repeat protein n=1 Tax=Simplicispira psychrophila TaxID=80882 RepID=UPI00068C6D9E|nr:SEL1-like repeat protein [Simplicispira psychrophila]
MSRAPCPPWPLPCASAHSTLLCCLALALCQGGVCAQAQGLPQAQPIDPAQLHPTAPRYRDPGQQRMASPDTPQHIDPEQLNAHALQPPGPDNPSQERALQKLRVAANAISSRRASGHPAPRDAAWLLGLLALHGRAMPANAAEARYWFERAQRLGHPLAPAGLAWCLMDGCTGPPNPTAARPWIAKLRSADPGRALYLEWRLETQLAPLRIATPEMPNTPATIDSSPQHQLLVRAAQAGNAQALNELGLESVSSARLPQALAQFRAAALHSPAAAANARLLANRLQVQLQPTPGHQGADAWLTQARRYHRGDGVPANYTEALRLYQVAAANGSQAAQRMLERIYSRPGPDGAVDLAWMQQLANLDITREGAVLSILSAPSPQLFVHDPTPLYDMIPLPWRAAQNGSRH